MAEDLIVSNAKMSDVATALNITPQQLLQQFVPHADLIGQIFGYIEANGVTTASRIEANVPGATAELVSFALQLYVIGGQGVKVPRA